MNYFDDCINCKKRYPACQDTCQNMKKNKQKYNKDKMIVMGKKTAEKAERDYIYDHYEMIRKKR